MTTPLPPLGSAERRLLVHCARLDVDAERAAETAALMRQPLQWDAVLLHAWLHSVATLVRRHLKHAGIDTHVPPVAKQRLLQLAHATEFRNRLFRQEHMRLADALARAGIPIIVPKGLSLVELVYGGLALRPLIDLIYLVPADAVQAAAHALRVLGYAQQPLRPIDGAYRWCCPQLLFETVRPMRVQVLLQWDLVNWPRLHRFLPEQLWRRAQPATLAGQPTLLLSPPDQVLYLCLQADNHGYFNRAALDSVAPADLLFATWSNNRLIRFTDIYEVARHCAPAIDWPALVERAQACGIAEAVATSLRLTTELLGPIAPGAAVAALGPPAPRRMRRTVFEALVAPRSTMLNRLVASVWERLSGYGQIRAARLMGLLEVMFPDGRTPRQRYGAQSPLAMGAARVQHAAVALARSLGAVTGLWLARRLGKLRAAAPRVSAAR
jgi:hypothetical protein